MIFWERIKVFVLITKTHFLEILPSGTFQDLDWAASNLILHLTEFQWVISIDTTQLLLSFLAKLHASWPSRFSTPMTLVMRQLNTYQFNEYIE